MPSSTVATISLAFSFPSFLAAVFLSFFLAVALGFVFFMTFGLVVFAAFGFITFDLVSVFFVEVAATTGATRELTAPGVIDVVHCHILSTNVQASPSFASSYTAVSDKTSP